MSNFTAQNLGAGKPGRVQKGWKSGIKMVWVISIPFILLYMLIPEALLRLFVDNPSPTTLETGRQLLRIVCIFYLVVSVKIISDSILKGAGNMKCFMISTFSDLILRVGLAYVLSRTALRVTGIWLSWPIGWSVGTAISLYFYRKDSKNFLTEEEIEEEVEADLT